MTWRIDPQPAGPNGPMIPILQVIILQDAWRALTKKSQAALVAIDENLFAGLVVHPASLRALKAHGLLDEFGLITEAGRAVVRHRPGKTEVAT
jgi:hypothetical protein